MWDMEPRKVLVGVDTADCEGALQYAVAEAGRRGCGLHLVHVARPVLAACALDDLTLVDGELRETSKRTLAAAAGRVQELFDERLPDDDRLSVSTELTHGSVVGALQSLSRHACLLVMEHRGMGERGESPTLSITAGLAAVAHCPVVAVPHAWRETATGTVVLGVEDPDRDQGLVAAAEHEAARRGAQLVVVSAAERAVEELLTLSEAAQVVVLGRHHRKHVVGAALGRTPRELLRHATVPVLVVDPVVGDRTPRPGRRALAVSGRS